MFAAACNPLPFHCFIERAGVAHNLFDGFPITAAAQRIVGIIIERNVEHGAKIEIKTEKPQQSSGYLAVPADKIDIPFVAQLLCVRWLVPDQTQSRYAAAFLIDGNDRFDLAEAAQVVDQPTQVRGALDIAAEKNKTTGLNASE